jgi:Cu+-exporting ATPase
MTCGCKCDSDNGKEDAEINKTLFVISCFCSLLLLFGMLLPNTPLHNPYIQLFLASLVVCISLKHFLPDAIKTTLALEPNMNVLILLGSLAAYIYSIIGLLLGAGHEMIFFESAATIPTVVLIGNWMEERAVKRATSAIQQIEALKPKQVRLIAEDGSSSSKAPEEITLGEIISLASGERVPLDGAVISGSGTVDQSIVTGESLPIEKTAGSQLISGSLVISGTFKMKVSKVDADSFLNQMLQLVREAQSRRPKIQRIADKASTIFVPSVIVVALLTAIILPIFFDVEFGEALIRAVAVLVIACPCAIGIATPIAVTVSIGTLAKNGVMLRGGDVIQELAEIKKVVFDKTGTLTEGVLTSKIEILDQNFTPQDIDAILTSFTDSSLHPTIKTLRKSLKRSSSKEFKEIEEIAGIGMRAVDHNQTIWELGGKRLLDQLGVTYQEDHDLFLTHNKRIIAQTKLEDRLKNGVTEALNSLQNLRIENILLSGDKKERCQELAEKLALNQFIAEADPADKLAHIQSLSEKSKIAFVGDGINDAPALAAANVGISLAGATDIALSSAKVILNKNELSQLPDLIIYAKRSLKVIKQNLFWAFCYNICAIPLAIFGYMSPILASLVMVASDVCVIGNSLQLRRYK